MFRKKDRDDFKELKYYLKILIIAIIIIFLGIQLEIAGYIAFPSIFSIILIAALIAVIYAIQMILVILYEMFFS